MSKDNLEPSRSMPESDLMEKIVAAISAGVEALAADVSGKIYAVVVQADNGCTALGLAANTIEHVEEQVAVHRDDAERTYLETACTEFVHVDFDAFEEVNAAIDELQERFFAGEFGDDVESIEALIGDAVSEALVEVNLSGVLGGSRTGEILQGMQFADPSGEVELRLMRESSQATNSVEWHQRVVELVDRFAG